MNIFTGSTIIPPNVQDFGNKGVQSEASPIHIFRLQISDLVFKGKTYPEIPIECDQQDV